ncbi:adhesion G-protein coupled receptor D1-like [Babylonia areolata]|uniref:adhesion G-protein coupled receptor D1-like n=1 Tax=Babylonia areolata TaxID=304850 RepID=UPI003FD090F1
MPLILVTISAAADWQGYGTSTSCWLSTQRNTIWSFVGPALAIIIVNLVILAAVIKIVMASAKLDKHGELDHIRAGVKAALLLLPLLGLTWVFGLAAVNKDLVIFQYLFALFNTLQGFFIFLFHCVFNTEVRQALRRLQERRSLQRGDLSSLAGFSTSPSTSPTPSVQTPDPKKGLGRGDSTTDVTPGVSAPYKVNRIVPTRHTSTTNIGNRTVTSTQSSTNVYARERRAGNSHPGTRRKTQEMSLMFI